MVFVFQKVFTNTIFYQILVFGDTNISIKIIFGLFWGIFLDEIAEHTDSLAYYRIFNIWLAQRRMRV